MVFSFLKSGFLSDPRDKALAFYIQNNFGFYPKNFALYKLAFRHKSVAIEQHNSARMSNERLEYLGDAILSAIVAEYLFKLFPTKDEGFLTEMRSKMVSRVQLNKLSQKLGMDEFIESQQEIFGPNRSMMGDAFEAFIGALYLDRGFEFTKKIFIDYIIAHHYDLEELETTEFNYKSKLIEWAQKEKIALDFNVIPSNGGRHQKQYTVEIMVDNKAVCQGMDYSIKGAEQLAAAKAYDILGLNR